MAVKPQVQLFFPCAGVEINDNANTVTITNPFSTLYFPPGTTFPCLSGIIYFFVSIKGGIGKFHCRVRGSDENRAIIVESKPTPIVFSKNNRFDGVQVVFHLPEFEISEPGVVEFELLANYLNDPIATCVIRFRGT